MQTVAVVVGEHWIRWVNEHDECHRATLPAIEYESGTQAWFLNNKRHRTDGPALTGLSGEAHWCSWYLNDRSYSEKEFHQKLKELRWPLK